MTDATTWLWYFGYGEEPEGYQYSFATRDEAIKAGRQETPDGAAFSIIEAVKSRSALSLPDGDTIVNCIIDANDDAWGEDGFGDLIGTKEEIAAAELEMTALIAAWFERHAGLFPEPWEFAETRNHETFFQPPAKP